MPKLPPLPASFHDNEDIRVVERELKCWALDYGRAIAEACAVICMSIVDSDDPAQCAAAIREAAKEIGDAPAADIGR